MIEYKIFANIEDSKNIEEEERNLFVRGVLEAIGLDELDEVWPEVLLSIEDKINLREFLNKYGILILNVNNEKLEIYVDKEIIAVWFKPFYKLRIDPLELDPAKKKYVELNIRHESIFENDVDDGEVEEE